MDYQELKSQYLDESTYDIRSDQTSESDNSVICETNDWTYQKIISLGLLYWSHNIVYIWVCWWCREGQLWETVLREWGQCQATETSERGRHWPLLTTEAADHRSYYCCYPASDMNMITLNYDDIAGCGLFRCISNKILIF